MLLHCSKCNSSCHPTCVGLSLDLISYVTSYEWECTDCKQCMKCQASHFMRIEPRLSWFYNYISFALCNFPISRILLMRTRCSSATSVTEDITSTALDSKRSPAVDTASYTTYYIQIRDGRPAPRKKGCPSPPRPAKKQVLPRPAKIGKTCGAGRGKVYLNPLKIRPLSVPIRFVRQ